MLDIERVIHRGPFARRRDEQCNSPTSSVVDRLILVARAGVSGTSTSSSGWPRCPWAAGYGLLQLPLVLPAGANHAGRIVGKAIGTGFGARPAQCCAFWTTCQSRRLRSAAPCGGSGGLAGGRWSAGPMLFDQAIPVQIIWGAKDVVLPVRHAHGACPPCRAPGGDFRARDISRFTTTLRASSTSSRQLWTSLGPPNTTRPRCARVASPGWRRATVSSADTVLQY